MVVTELACRESNDRRRGMIHRVADLIRQLAGVREIDDRSPDGETSFPGEFTVLTQSTEPCEPGESTGAGGDVDRRIEFRWRRHPQLRQPDGTAGSPDPGDRERSARSAAVRGLYLARSGRFGDARASFAAGAAEPSVDLAAIAGFWDLPRSGMLAAVGAYDDVERYRDAAALGARIRLRYRPRALSSSRISTRPPGTTPLS